jgi:hypothetical protein
MTKKIRYGLLFLISLIITNTCRPQAAILSTRDNIVYQEVVNPLTINLSEHNCKNIILQTDNGAIEREHCNILYTPKRLGVARIEIFNVVRGRKTKIGESIFRVRTLPDPYAHFAGRSGGKISKEVAKANQGLICYVPGLTCQPNIMVDRYSIIIVKSKDSLLVTHNKGARFESRTFNLIKELERGDVLIFSQIIVRTADNVERSVSPIEFIIE